MIEAGRDDVAGGFTESATGRTRRWAAALGLLLVVGVGLGWALIRVKRSEAYQIQVLRQALSSSAAPDELVVVDDELLGWALRRKGGGAGLPTLQVMSDNVAPSSLLAELDGHRQEIVVVARPGSRLVRTLSAAGFVLVPRPGPAAWDIPGKGARLIGWGRYRIFFVRLPKTVLSDGGGREGAVESGVHSGMQHEMK